MQSFKNILHPNKNSATSPETDSRGSHPRAPNKAARTPVKDTQPRVVTEAANNFPNTNASYVAPQKGVQSEDVNTFPGTNPRS